METQLNNYSEQSMNVSMLDTVQIQVVSCGECRWEKERTSSGGPNQTSFSLHYVHSGAGYVQYDDGAIHPVRRGEIFCLVPAHKIRYYADKKSPWRYSWITFTGINMPKLFSRLNVSAEAPVLQVKNRALLDKIFSANLQECQQYPKYAEIISKGYLYRAFSVLLEETSGVPEEKKKPDLRHVAKAQAFIEENYHRIELSLSMVAKHCNLNKAYLSRLFAKEMGVPMGNYITFLRVSKARCLFDEGETSVKKVAYMVGFDSPYYFCKVFKSVNQPPPCTPSMYIAQVQEKRKALKNENAPKE